MDAICISCGRSKDHPAEPCSHCGVDPNENDAMLVRSMYLSTDRFSVDDPDGARYTEELGSMAARIQSGQPIEFDEKELARLRVELEAMKAIPPAAVWGALLRMLLPIIVVIVVLCLLLSLL